MKASQMSYVKNKFSEYYRNNASNIKPPTSMERREFGFLLFEKDMLRHKSFDTTKQLAPFLNTITPANVYYSCAYYENPEAKMDEKGWLGADLVFDIDADHIHTPCSGIHKERKRKLLCECCLKAAKWETLKLIDMLQRDFGFSEDETTVAFSGHRGYHVHVQSEDVKTLNQIARKEITDYVTGLGLEIDNLIRRGEERKLTGPKLDDFGWRGRVAKGAYSLLRSSDEKLKKAGVKKHTQLIKFKNKISDSWKRGGPWGRISGIRPEGWRELAEKSVIEQSARIDTAVTTDIHRLIRLNNTLHGKTGLKKTIVQGSVEKFDPLKRAVAFTNDYEKVYVSEAPKFRLQDEDFGPYRKEEVKLPTAAALLLVCKNVAEVK